MALAEASSSISHAALRQSHTSGRPLYVGAVSQNCADGCTRKDEWHRADAAGEKPRPCRSAVQESPLRATLPVNQPLHVVGQFRLCLWPLQTPTAGEKACWRAMQILGSPAAARTAPPQTDAVGEERCFGRCCPWCWRGLKKRATALTNLV